MATPETPEFLKVSEVASRLRLSKMTIYRMVNDGALGHVRVGRSVRIPSVECDRYLAEHLRQANAEPVRP